GGLVGPERAVPDDARVDCVHADRGELKGERVDEPRDSTVDGRDRGRARVGSVLRAAAVEHYAGVDRRVEAVQQGVHDLGVADELEGGEADGALDVVLARGVRVALDGREHEPVYLSEARELRGDCRRLRN